MARQQERARKEAAERAERARKQAEHAREEARKQAERARKQAERARKQAERARKEAREREERARHAAEKAREEARKQAERARKEARERAERIREANERSQRKAREESKKKAEYARREREHAEAEARKSEDENRKHDEAKRREREKEQAEHEQEQEQANSGFQTSGGSSNGGQSSAGSSSGSSSGSGGGSGERGDDEERNKRPETAGEDDQFDDGDHIEAGGGSDDGVAPPRTLVELFKRLTGSGSGSGSGTSPDDDDGGGVTQSAATGSDSASTVGSANGTATPTPKQKKPKKKEEEKEKPKKQAKRRPLPVTPALPVPERSFKPREVIAVNLAPKELAAVARLGFKVTKPKRVRGAARPAPARILAPIGMDARNARNYLARRFPRKRFALNRVYRFPPALSQPEGQKGSPAPGGSSKQPAKGLFDLFFPPAPAPPKTGQPSDGQPGRPRQGSGDPWGPATIKKAPGPAARGERLPTRPARPADPCRRNRCFARRVIHWRDDLRRCSARLRIGVIDTGFDPRHPAFRDRRIYARSFVQGRRKPRRHGTAVLGLLAGNPESQTPGFVPDADFFMASVFHRDPRGEPATDTLSLLKALNWLAARDVKLVNMSFTGPPDELLHDTLRKMSDKGVVFIAAAGNGGPNAPPRYPAAYPRVVAVTAVGRSLKGYVRANRGHYIDVAGPGVGIWTAMPDRRAGYQSGTSFAAPAVTALLATIYKAGPHGADARKLLRRLDVKDLGRRGADPVYGRGLVLAPRSCRPGADQPSTPAIVVGATPPPIGATFGTASAAADTLSIGEIDGAAGNGLSLGFAGDITSTIRAGAGDAFWASQDR